MTGQEHPSPRGKRLPSSFYNTISLAGTAVAVISLALIVFMVALEHFADSHSPYVGIIAFMILPGFLVVGLAMAAAGARTAPPGASTGT